MHRLAACPWGEVKSVSFLSLDSKDLVICSLAIKKGYCKQKLQASPRHESDADGISELCQVSFYSYYSELVWHLLGRAAT
jgi:hypothetical protein